jgi:hypothetical protein
VYDYNKNTMSEQQPKLHVDGRSDTKLEIYTVQHDARIYVVVLLNREMWREQATLET